jgi:hypothetical protein
VVTVGVTFTAVPLMVGRYPEVMMPVPLMNTPMSVAFPPSVIVVGFATKLVMVGVGGVGVLPLLLPPPPPQARERVRAPKTAVCKNQARIRI